MCVCVGGVCPAGLVTLPGLVNSRAFRGQGELGWILAQGWEEEEEEAAAEVQNRVTVPACLPLTAIFALDFGLAFWPCLTGLKSTSAQLPSF